MTPDNEILFAIKEAIQVLEHYDTGEDFALVTSLRRLREIENLGLPLFRETVMRAQLAMPETSQDLQWFDEGLDYRNSDFQIRLYKYFDLGNLNSVRFRKSRQKLERPKQS